MVLPPVNVTEAFECTVNPIMERILNNLHESQTLAALRDALLPKLVSGEFRVDHKFHYPMYNKDLSIASGDKNAI